MTLYRCARCQGMKPRDQFANRSDRAGIAGRQYYCKPCMTIANKTSGDKRNQETLMTATSGYNEWTDHDLHLLEVWTFNRVPGVKIARRLNRSLKSIYTMRCKMGFEKGKTYTAVPGSPIDTTYLKELINA